VGSAFLSSSIWRSSHPHAAELGYFEKEDVLRNLKRFPKAKIYPETLILRVDGSLYFANMHFLEGLLRKSLADKPAVKWVIMDLSGVNDIDAVAIDTLEEIMETYKERGIRFLFFKVYFSERLKELLPNKMAGLATDHKFIGIVYAMLNDFHHDLPINGVGYRVLVSYIFALRVYSSNFGAI
jgi:MFS superfamily sulfate permease-like transporter